MVLGRAKSARLIRSVVLGIVLGLALGVSSGAKAQDKVIKSFASGQGPDAVGLGISENSPDREEDGPQALATGDNGSLFLLDQVNGRILSFDPSDPSAPPRTLELPKDVQPIDLVVKGDNIYVWDGKVHALQPLGPQNAPTRGLTETRSNEPVDDETRTAFAQMGSVSPDEVASGDSTRGMVPGEKKPPILARQAVNTRGLGPVVVDVAVTDGDTGARLDVRQKGQSAIAATLRLRVRNRIGSVAFLEIDRSGRMFVLAENIPVNIGDTALAAVVRFSPKGVIDGLYELPLSQTSIVSRRAVTVSPDGDVYFLKSQKNVVDVIGLGFRPTPNAKLVDVLRVQPNYASLAWTSAKGVNMAVGPLSRQRVLQTAFAFEGAQWTVAPSNYGEDPGQLCSGFAGRTRRPPYLYGKEGQNVRSVPYCWGCQGSLNQFMSRVQRGVLAGNVCTRDNPRPDAAGVDCSSFVSAAWGLSTHFTTAAIPAIAKQLSNPWDLQPGDALDKPGSHVMLFLGFTPDRQAQVMEASPGGCQGRVCRNVYPLSALLGRGYLPVRYRALLDASEQQQ